MKTHFASLRYELFLQYSLEKTLMAASLRNLDNADP